MQLGGSERLPGCRSWGRAVRPGTLMESFIVNRGSKSHTTDGGAASTVVRLYLYLTTLPRRALTSPATPTCAQRGTSVWSLSVSSLSVCLHSQRASTDSTPRRQSGTDTRINGHRLSDSLSCDDTLIHRFIYFVTDTNKAGTFYHTLSHKW